jgi:hypothetical protein
LFEIKLSRIQIRTKKEQKYFNSITHSIITYRNRRTTKNFFPNSFESETLQSENEDAVTAATKITEWSHKCTILSFKQHHASAWWKKEIEYW